MQRRYRRRWWSLDDGAASVLVLAIVTVTLLLVGFLTLVGVVSAARHEAQSAADLAALAGAQALISGMPACGVAVEVGAANGAEVIACEVSGDQVVVKARVPVAGMWAHASARAGPGY